MNPEMAPYRWQDLTMAPMLTIAIPTFNRAGFLQNLLKLLKDEVSTLAAVEVLVSDNGSTDGTDAVIAMFSAVWPALVSTRSKSNIGADNNIRRCFDLARGRYIWIMGDDDLPARGLVRGVLAIIARECPDAIYMTSVWREVVVPDEIPIVVDPLRYAKLDRLIFAEAVNVWFTFISGIIVRKTGLFPPRHPDAGSFVGTNLVQLGWVLEAVKQGQTFIFIPEPCIVATAANSGGYAVLATFGDIFSKIVGQVFGDASEIARKIIRKNLIDYMPGLIWSVRFQVRDQFSNEDLYKVLRPALGKYLVFWLLLLPIGMLPKTLARLFFLVARARTKIAELRGRSIIRATSQVTGF
jgi:glycosyltransferase involved in cell wall biosynthesis